jgi:hypothetical protein
LPIPTQEGESEVIDEGSLLDGKGMEERNLNLFGRGGDEV